MGKLVIALYMRLKEEINMRDHNRIYPFCSEFAELWAKYPDLRFGQIMYNISKYVEMEHKKDMFYMEDEELMKIIRHQLRWYE